MKVNGFYFFLLLFLACIALSSLYYPLRYIKYALPLVPLVALYDGRKIPINAQVLGYYFTLLGFYVILIIYSFFQNLLFSEVSGRFLSNAVFILSPLLFITLILPVFDWSRINQYVSTIFVVNILLFLSEEWSGLLDLAANPAVLLNALYSSEMPTESNFAYVFGFFLIYFLCEKYPKSYKIVAFLFFVLCFKRVVIAAVVASMLIYFSLSLLRMEVSRSRRLFTFLGVLVNLAYIKFTQLMVSGRFDKFVLEQTGYSTDRFLMGRKTFYTEAFDKAGAYNWFGLGLGKIDDVIFGFFGIPVNLHSEVLKNYFEFGVIMFVVWLTLIFYRNLFSNKAAIFLIYFNVLILTDNVFIYFDIMFYFYFFILILLSEKAQAFYNKNSNELEPHRA